MYYMKYVELKFMQGLDFVNIANLLGLNNISTLGQGHVKEWSLKRFYLWGVSLGGVSCVVMLFGFV